MHTNLSWGFWDRKMYVDTQLGTAFILSRLSATTHLSCTQCEGYGNRRARDACSSRPVAPHAGVQGGRAAGLWVDGRSQGAVTRWARHTGGQCSPAGFLQEAWHPGAEQTAKLRCIEDRIGAGSEARQPRDGPPFFSLAEVGSPTLLPPFAAADFFKASLSKIYLPIF